MGDAHRTAAGTAALRKAAKLLDFAAQLK